jgi:hypothetical protein
MAKILTLVMVVFLFSGCSLLKIASAPLQPVKNSMPQQVTKSNKQMKCKGEIEVKENGTIYCSDGFYLSEVQSEQKDRKLTWREKIAQFFTNTAGYILWAVIISIVLTLLGLGWLVSGFWSATFSVGSKAFKQIVGGIQKAKNNGGDFVNALNASTDEDVKKFIAEFKLKNNIK